jgi:hypothetical protein
MEQYQSDIEKIEAEIIASKEVDMESEEFVAFALKFVSKMRNEW